MRNFNNNLVDTIKFSQPIILLNLTIKYYNFKGIIKVYNGKDLS